MNNQELKSSDKWQEQFEDLIQVMDPDGWDRTNYDYSWYEEKITKDEFFNRVCFSSCMFKVSYMEFCDILGAGGK